MNGGSGGKLQDLCDDRWRHSQGHLEALAIGAVGQGLTVFILAQIWQPAAIFVLSVSILMAVSNWYQGQGGSRIVLWIRRFDRPQRRAFRNLKRAVRYLGTIVTLRDSSVRSVKEMTYVRWFNPRNLLFSLRIAMLCSLLQVITSFPHLNLLAAIVIAISVASVIFDDCCRRSVRGITQSRMGS